MFKIGEFSRLTQISVRMLRFYDEQGLLKPAEVKPENGYRYYSVEQIPDLQRILLLRDMDCSTEEIRHGLANWSDKYLVDLFSAKLEQIREVIRHREYQTAKIETALKDIRSKALPVHYNITIKSVPAYSVLSLRRVIPSYYDEGLLWKEMTSFIFHHQLPVAEDAHCLTIYQDDDSKEKDVDVEVCTVIDFSKMKAIPEADGYSLRIVEAVETMACAFVYGPYENILAAYQSFAHWLEKNPQYEMGATSRQICHCGPHNENQPEKYLTEIQIPVITIEKAPSSDSYQPWGRR